MIRQILFITVLLLTTQATAADWAGRIEWYDGPAKSYLLERDGQPVPVEQFYQPLFSGDKLTLTDKNHRMGLRLGGGTEITELSHENSPYSVELQGRVPTPEVSLLTWVGQTLGLLQKEEVETTTTVTGGGRGTEEVSASDAIPLYLTLPQYRRRTMRVLAGEQRALHLAWEGGQAPYTVTILQDGKSLQSFSTDKKRPQTPALDWQAGAYQIQVKDNTGAVERYEFQGVAERPAWPADFDSLPPEMRATTQATWLAAQKKGAWAFEAYQLIAGIAGEYPPARVLRDALEQGARIKPQRQGMP